MGKRCGISTTGVIIAVVIVVAAAAAVVVILRSDPTGRSGSGLGKEFTYDDRQYRRTDPALIRYRQVQRIETGFQSARGIAVGPDDSIYVAGDRVVEAFDNRGERRQKFPLDDSPQCLAVAADGTVYVGMIDRVEVCPPQGKLRAKWDNLGEKAIVTSIAVSGGNVFVADSGNRVVLRYDLSGRLVNRIGRPDEARGIPGLLVRRPCVDVAVGPEEVLWVTNPGRWRVEAYTFAGDLQSWWGEHSENIEGFCGCCNPTDIAILPDGSFATTEKGLPRVKVYNDRGGFECVVAGPESFAKGTVGLDLAVDSAGRVLVLDPVAKAVRIFVRISRGGSPDPPRLVPNDADATGQETRRAYARKVDNR